MRPSILNPLFADITALKGVGPRIAALMSKSAGPRVVDVLFTLPHSLVDRSNRPKIAEAAFGALATLEVTVDRHEPSKIKRLPYRVVCSDETGFLTLIFFHARPDYLIKTLPEGEKRLISGRIEDYDGARQMTHPDYIVALDRAEDLPLFEPVYPLTSGLSAVVMRRASVQAQNRAPALPEWQEPSWLKAREWPTWQEAIASVHNPTSNGELSSLAPARQRLAYDELLSNQLALLMIRGGRTKSAGRALVGDNSLRQKAMKALPFELTGSQVTVIDEITREMASKVRMVRLVQGDVGSGKTMVAFFAMLNAVEAGFQAALMAPTEILARQHLKSLRPLADAAGVTIEALTGRDKGKEREAKANGIRQGYVDIIIGTHAIFQDSIAFKDLGLVVVDEQHRFGVHQRIALADKGPKPDTLVMTATPIPRTLALTAYGDMEASAITDKPPGRKPVTTRTIPIERLDDVIGAVRRTLEKGEQVYWVCPLVEESEHLPLVAADARYKMLREVFGDAVGIVHGRMDGAEKDAVMTAFYRGEIGVLIATTVIEVGVDAPNATAIIIEHAERFGLAQLHQLRGRVGRGDKQGACLLLYKGPLGETAKSRLQILRETEDGFKIAEEDLRLRGAGDLLGTAQSGFPQFKIADLAVHGDLLAAARDDAKLTLERDPSFTGERSEALRVLLYLFSREDAVKLIRSG